jgi:hypothetical protein
MPYTYASSGHHGHRSLYAGNTPFAPPLVLGSDDGVYPIIDVPPSTLTTPYYGSMPAPYYTYPVNPVYTIPSPSYVGNVRHIFFFI